MRGIQSFPHAFLTQAPGNVNLSDMEMGVRGAPLERVSAVKINRHGDKKFKVVATTHFKNADFWSDSLVQFTGTESPRMSRIKSDSGLYEEKLKIGSLRTLCTGDQHYIP